MGLLSAMVEVGVSRPGLHLQVRSCVSARESAPGGPIEGFSFACLYGGAVLVATRILVASGNN